MQQIIDSVIQKEIDLVTNDILSRFPNCSYTIDVILWDDNTHKVECRHGSDDGNKLYISTYVDGKLNFEIIEISK